ncbi:hypothetical protein EVAR_72016_1 [Eumeta japonica]|uniref:Uncharacterized protein n=1 Tax=Eumeta variegata TaxID=151549 RepID=A0A4C1SI03_EUMVA|nr:hypothetical protein EVAR_72016_1 [Eumeta japonica]
MSTGALSDTSSCASANGFGAEADFVADFGSADIFNATVASSPASSISSSTTNNGYAKMQPMKVSAAHQQFMNGHGGGGGLNNSTNLQNGNLVATLMEIQKILQISIMHQFTTQQLTFNITIGVNIISNYNI